MIFTCGQAIFLFYFVFNYNWIRSPFWDFQIFRVVCVKPLTPKYNRKSSKNAMHFTLSKGSSSTLFFLLNWRAFKCTEETQLLDISWFSVTAVDVPIFTILLSILLLLYYSSHTMPEECLVFARPLNRPFFNRSIFYVKLWV